MHPAERYIIDVTQGKKLAPQAVVNAYKRHLKDLKQAKKKGWVFNPNYSQRVIKMFAALRHYDGAYQGRPFILEPWQQAIIWVLFGWRLGHRDGPRRFRTAYIEIPKKNGKTPLGAGFMIYLAFFDGNYITDQQGRRIWKLRTGVNVYSAATKRDQAKLCLKDAQNYISFSPFLNGHFDSHTNAIHKRQQLASIQALSKDTGTSDGIKVYGAVIDELHRHPTSDMVDLLNSSAASDQMLLIEITTAGTDRQSVCYKHHQYTNKVNRGLIEDPHWFGLVYSLDHGDDWKLRENWFKANPNLGTGKDLVEFERKVLQAINDPTKENSTKRYEFNIWTGAEDKWISESVWDAAGQDIPDEELLDPAVEVFGGLDLAGTKDFNALALLFYHTEEGWLHLKTWFWCPEDMIDKRVEQQNMDFAQWVKAGYIKKVPGQVVGSEDRAPDIIEICQHYGVHSVAYDKFNAIDTIGEMMKHGIECVEQLQYAKDMNWPTKMLEQDLIKGYLTHDKNPVMSWMMDNVLLEKDGNDNYKINKKKAIDKVDGPVAAVMAESQYLARYYGDEGNILDRDAISF